MASLLLRILVFVIAFGLSAEHLSFSFRSQNDGYIYPSWKKYPIIGEHLYDNAVVTGDDFTILCGGDEVAKGPNGIFTHYQCLTIAEMLEGFVPKPKKSITYRVLKAYDKSFVQLGLPNLKDDMSDLATNLVYMKVHEEKLYSGIIGKAGLVIFRFDGPTGILKLYEKLDGRRREGKSQSIKTPKSILTVNEETFSVQEGDIAVIISDGLDRILPPSFLTAAASFLISRMINNKRENKLDYDYDYDLADLVEGYVQNLSELSIHLRNTFIEKLYNLVKNDLDYFNKMNIKPIDDSVLSNLKSQEEIDRANIEHLKKHFIQQNLSQKIIKKIQNLDPKTYNTYQENALKFKKSVISLHRNQNKSNKKNTVQEQVIDPPHLRKPSLIRVESKQSDPDDLIEEDLESDFFTKDEDEHSKEYAEMMKNLNIQQSPDVDIDVAMDRIFQNEICNVFDPTDNRLVFRIINKAKTLTNQAFHNAKHAPNRAYEPVDCFQNTKIKKKATRHPSKNKWKCKDLVDLSFTKYWHSIVHYDFDECLSEAISVLPEKTTHQEIAEAFNSRYFARNIALAAKYVANDSRFKAHHIILKYFFNEETYNIEFSKEILEETRLIWQSRERDISIAATAVKSHQSKDNSKRSPSFKLDLTEQSKALELIFKSYTSQPTQRQFI